MGNIAQTEHTERQKPQRVHFVLSITFGGYIPFSFISLERVRTPFGQKSMQNPHPSQRSLTM